MRRRLSVLEASSLARGAVFQQHYRTIAPSTQRDVPHPELASSRDARGGLSTGVSIDVLLCNTTSAALRCASFKFHPSRFAVIAQHVQLWEDGLKIVLLFLRRAKGSR